MKGESRFAVYSYLIVTVSILKCGIMFFVLYVVYVFVCFFVGLCNFIYSFVCLFVWFIHSFFPFFFHSFIHSFNTYVISFRQYTLKL